MKSRISILTLTLVCGVTLLNSNAEANRGGRRARYTATAKMNKPQQASDYKNSKGADTSNARSITQTDCGNGTYFDGATCVVCASGTWSTAGSASCVSCGDGVAACNQANGDAIACLSGYKLDGVKCVSDTSKAEAEKFKELVQKYSLQLTEVSASCSGIAGALERISGLNTASTVSSGIGTLAAGGAVATSILKNNDKLEDNAKEKKTKTQKILNSDVMKTATTGLMAGATLTSGVSATTSFIATATASDVLDKIGECNSRVKDLKIIKSALDSVTPATEEIQKAQKISEQAAKVIAACEISKGSIETVKNLTLASGIVSSVGTATGAAGTVTSILANKQKPTTKDTATDAEKSTEAEKGTESNEDNHAKRTKMDTATTVLAGVTAGTSATSTILGINAGSKVSDVIDDAKECEDVLRTNLVDVNFVTKTDLDNIKYSDGSESALPTTTDTTTTNN